MKNILIIILFFIYITSANAQHCKFDGQHVIVIKLVTAKGKPRPPNGFHFYIRNPVNEIVDTLNICTDYTTKGFEPANTLLLETVDSAWNIAAKKYTKLPLFKMKAVYAIILSDAELKCLKDVNEKIVVTCRYAKSSTTRRIQIPKESIYSLCSNINQWKNIKPCEIILPKKNPF